MTETPPPGYYLVPIPPPQPPTNGIATAAVVLGTIGAVLAVIPVLGLFLAWLPSLLGIVFGHIGQYLGRQRGGLNTHYAVGGYVAGYLGLIVFPLGWFILLAVAGQPPS